MKRMRARALAVLLLSGLLLAAARASAAGDVPEGWSQATTDHFVFRYDPMARSRVAPIVDIAEREILRIMDALGLKSMEPIEVRFARNIHEMARMKPGDPPPSWATGMAMREGRLILVSLTATDDAHPTDTVGLFAHEVVHIAEWDASGGNPTPIWFREGLAIHLSGEFSTERGKVLLGAAIRNRLLPLSSLSSHYPGDGRKVNLAYAQSADLVGFLEDAYGPGYLSAVLWRVRHGDEFEPALESLAGRSLHQIQAEWLGRLDVWYRWVPSLTGGGTLWALVALMLVAVYVRRRKHARMLYQRWEKEEQARKKQMEEIIWEHWDPNTIPKPSDDRTSVIHEGSTHTLH